MNAGLDLTLPGVYQHKDRPVLVFEKPVDLRALNFPDREREQIERIGLLIQNLRSHKSLYPSHNLTNNKGKEKLQRDNFVDRWLPTFEQAFRFWFENGRLKSTAEQDMRFELFYGVVYQVDLERSKAFYSTESDYPHNAT
jgi:hypothetical protein